MRDVVFANGEFYHVYNRGVDKRTIFSHARDVDRFFQGMEEFNAVEPIGSIFENSFRKNKLGNSTSKQSKQTKDSLVRFIAFCVNPNHYHFLLEQVVDGGISSFMKRLSGGYTKYFNERYHRTGVLFQGRFKAVHIDSNEYLLHLSAYINLNDQVHQLGNSTSKLTSKLVKSRSSWGEYVGRNGENFCKKEIILKQFKNKNLYNTFAQDALQNIIERKADLRAMGNYLLE